MRHDIIKFSKIFRTRISVATFAKVSLAPNPAQLIKSCVISSFCCEAEHICGLLRSYAAYDINSLPTFWNNLSVPSSRVRNPYVRLCEVVTATKTFIGCCMKLGLRTFHRRFWRGGGANKNFLTAVFYLNALILFDLFG
jgi:hypothetical protein